ncbi:hypothetical protein TI03_03010 [Achromatium sp. WMS1]|nr:hypothetical protein TI03_03010 [Achromatium sp. WMS1]
MAISLAFDDLRYYSDQWADNQNITPAQRQHWPPETKLFEHWPSNHPNTARLLLEDGGDGEPVFHIKTRALQACGWNGDNHRFLDDMDLLRACRFLHLTPERTLLLLMKAQCERHYYDAAQLAGETQLLEQYKTKDYQDFAASRNQWQGYKQGFYLGYGKRLALDDIYDYLKQENCHIGYDDLDLFESLYHDARFQSRFLYSPTAPEITRFLVNKEAETQKRLLANDAERQRHWIARHHLRVCEQDITQVLWEQDEQRFAIAKVHTNYAIALGAEELQRLKLLLERERLSRAIALKEAQPELTQESIHRQVEQHLVTLLTAIDQQQMWILQGHALQICGPGGLSPIGGPIDPGANDIYQQQSRQLIRELRKLTHPDGTPLGRRFTPQQKQELDAFFDHIMSISREDICLGNRTLERLQRLKAQILELYAQEGLEVPTLLPPEDLSFSELCTWLEERATQIKKDISRIKDEMLHANNNPQYQEQLGVIASEANIKYARTILEQEIATLEAELQPLREHYARLFGDNALPCAI